MAKTKSQTDEPRETEGATSTAKKAKRPSKKQATKKTAKKPAKKTSTRSSTPRVSKKRSSKKPAKKQPPKKTAKKQSTKKTAKKPVKQAKKPAKKIERSAAQEERTVISSPPSRQRREQVQAKASAEQNRKEAETAQTQTPQDVQPEEMQWGRRTRRSAPIGWEDRAGVSTPVQPTRQQNADTEEKTVQASGVSTPVQPTRQQNVDTEEKTVQASAKPARTETPAQSKRDEPKKEDTRKVSRPPKGRNQGDQNKQRSSKRSSDRSRNRSQKPEQPSNKLTQILAQSWTEDKTRQFISEGFLGSLSPELVNNSKREPIPDAETLKEPLKMIRKILADECMVADDVTDLMLLDVVMNALSDRIDVCRLQAETNSLADIDAILELRYKADRRLIEAVNALKNA